VVGGTGANYSLLGWSMGDVDDQGNMSIDAPGFAGAGSTETVTVDWSGLATNTIYMGAISHNAAGGLAALTLLSIIVPD
jgi:hypothetical protein